MVAYEFISPEHEEFYNAHSDITALGRDYQALVYTLGISESCRNHFSDLFDSEKHLIKIDGLNKGWETGSSVNVVRLAFHLYTHQIPEGDDKAYLYTPMELLNNLDYDTRDGAITAISYFA